MRGPTAVSRGLKNWVSAATSAEMRAVTLLGGTSLALEGAGGWTVVSGTIRGAPSSLEGASLAVDGGTDTLLVGSGTDSLLVAGSGNPGT